MASSKRGCRMRPLGISTAWSDSTKSGKTGVGTAHFGIACLEPGMEVSILGRTSTLQDLFRQSRPEQ